MPKNKIKNFILRTKAKTLPSYINLYKLLRAHARHISRLLETRPIKIDAQQF